MSYIPIKEKFSMGYESMLGHTVGSDLNRWFTDSQKTLCYVTMFPYYPLSPPRNNTIALQRSQLNRDYGH